MALGPYPNPPPLKLKDSDPTHPLKSSKERTLLKIESTPPK